MRTLILLGASGSIGSQTIELLEGDPSSFRLLGVSVGTRTQCLHSIIEKFPFCKYICVKNEADMTSFKEKYPEINWYFGDKGLLDLIKDSSAEMVVNALLGFAGLEPSVYALENDKILCLANKESLVCGGHLIKKALRDHDGKLYPIDSEHVAIAKCLHENRKEIEKVILTASGGPFYFREIDFEKITKEDALKHPSWKMGAKITIDSSTLMNKGFEVIEACELFDLQPDDIEIVVHPQSYVHSGLLLKDGTYLIQVGKPDMKGPIEYALREGNVSYEDVISVGSLDELPYDFANFNEKRFPAVSLCKKARKMGGGALTILNAADEISVHLFLENKMKYLDIVHSCELALDNVSNIIDPSLDDLKKLDSLTRQWIQKR